MKIGLRVLHSCELCLIVTVSEEFASFVFAPSWCAVEMKFRTEESD